MQLFVDTKNDMEAVKTVLSNHETSRYSKVHIDKVGSQYCLTQQVLSDEKMIDLLIENGLDHIVGGA